MSLRNVVKHLILGYLCCTSTLSPQICGFLPSDSVATDQNYKLFMHFIFFSTFFTALYLKYVRMSERFVSFVLRHVCCPVRGEVQSSWWLCCWWAESPEKRFKLAGSFDYGIALKKKMHYVILISFFLSTTQQILIFFVLTIILIFYLILQADIVSYF